MYYLGKFTKKDDESELRQRCGLVIFMAYILTIWLCVVISEIIADSPIDFLSRSAWLCRHSSFQYFLRAHIIFAIEALAIVIVITIYVRPRQDRIYSWHRMHYKDTAFASQIGTKLESFDLNGKAVTLQSAKTDLVYQVSAQLERCFPNASIFIGLSCILGNNQKAVADIIMILGNTIFYFDCCPYNGGVSGETESAYWLLNNSQKLKNETDYLSRINSCLMLALINAGIPVSKFESIQLITAAEYGTGFHIKKTRPNYIYNIREKSGNTAHIPVGVHWVHADIHTKELPDLIKEIIPDYDEKQSCAEVENAKSCINGFYHKKVKTTGGFGKAYEK